MIPSKSDTFFNSEQFAKTFLKIQSKEKKIVPLRFNRAQRDFLSKRTGRDIILKARQLGFSTLLQAELFRVVTTGSAATLTLTHLDATTQAMRRMADRFYEQLPQAFRPLRKYANSTITTYPDFDSEAIIGTAGSSHGARGISITDAHFSEFAFYKDPELILAGALQSGNPRSVVIESTANGAQGLYHTLCMDALRGDSVWRLHFYEWWWDDNYRLPLAIGEKLYYTAEEQELVYKHGLNAEQIKWRRAKIGELGGFFLQEYPEDPISCFLLAGGSVFDLMPTNINAQAPTYQADHLYVAGIDWGQADDYTAMSIMNATTYQEVDLLMLRHNSWDSMINSLVEKCKQWRIEKLVVEKNAAGAMIEMLFNALYNLKYENGKYPILEAFTTTNKSKDTLVKLLQTGLSEDLLLLDHPVANSELRSYTTKQASSGVWTYSAPSGLHDDTVIARMLANYASYGLRIK